MEEVKFFEEGEHVFIIKIMPTKKGDRFTSKSFIEAEYISTNDYGYKFKVVKVISGSYKIGEEFICPKMKGWGTDREIFNTYEEAKQCWNKVIQECIDRVTSFYQVSIKKLNKELLL